MGTTVEPERRGTISRMRQPPTPGPVGPMVDGVVDPVVDGVVDLNADLGEEVTDDAALLAVVTSANVACGFHAGSPEVMRAVCEGAAAHGVRVGAQVSYRDRAGFGRRPME